MRQREQHTCESAATGRACARVLRTLLRGGRVGDDVLLHHDSHRRGHECVVEGQVSKVASGHANLAGEALVRPAPQSLLHRLRVGQLDPSQGLHQREQACVGQVAVVAQNHHVGVQHPAALAGHDRQVGQVEATGAERRAAAVSSRRDIENRARRSACAQTAASLLSSVAVPCACIACYCSDLMTAAVSH